MKQFRLKLIGKDVIQNIDEAHEYRSRVDGDLIIWGDVLEGTRNERETSDFNKLFFTYKIPGNIVVNNFTELFKSDINIALVNRDWNIYEVNSLADTEKISANLSEIILFITGLIYCQTQEFAEDSVGILELLFQLLNSQVKNGEVPVINQSQKTIQFRPQLLRHSRVLGILLSVYKNMGIYFNIKRDYRRSRFYLEKYRMYQKKDIDVLGWLAIAAFYLNDIPTSKTYTQEICALDDKNEVCLVNRGFWGIYERNYSRSLSDLKI